MANKRKRSSGLAAVPTTSSAGLPPSQPPRPHQRTAVPLPSNVGRAESQPRRQPSRISTAAVINPNANPDILDGQSSVRASPDGGEPANANDTPEHGTASNTAVAVRPDHRVQPARNKRKKGPQRHVKVECEGVVDNVPAQNGTAPSGTVIEETVGVTVDPEDEEGLGEKEDQDEDEVKEALSRPPPVNSDYLPLPWKGRLGYACLNTYLRNANPPVFSSRTCRIASILEHRHPLKDPSQPEHATKNRPDKDQPADIMRGRKYVEELGLANARDVAKMVRWNDKYGIKFMRLSSEMFPFASHAEYGYKLAPFAAETLAEVGKVVGELGHRVTTHPGQFTQLGSPRKQVIDASFLDLAYHDEMLSLLKLPPQQNRDAVMILHLGGAFGDKAATLDRFRENYAKLLQSVKNRLVLENDDVIWSVHDLLPLCQELNIPFVLDFHHHNIIFDASKIREGTKDIIDLFPQIIETWTKKGITPKMHYSEPCPDAITGRARRKHSPRVMTMPPCPDTMDLMIEAKDKEQAVFELMRTFKLPGFNTFSDIIPHVRQDENKAFKPKPKKAPKKDKKKKADELDDLDMKIKEVEEEEKPPPLIPDNEVGMGGPEGRVYWPPGMEDWLRPPKRVVKKKEDGGAATPATKKRKTTVAAASAGDDALVNGDEVDATTPVKKPAPKRAASAKKKAAPKAVPTPSPSDDDSSPLSDLSDGDGDDLGAVKASASANKKTRLAPMRQRSGRVSQRVSYKEEEADLST
ncbi:UV-endonuclease UvdE [Byssothecium circinans]|uniref:UV-endonuclease UvdE n=1 Tax=Byssothecium circinans TaxID=147558 RepID=A0A6A5UDU7_9PLEO|nr:UV-endonuclease UvdE [Byssothecium circinans]